MTPWIAACQASVSITNSQSSLRLTSIESVMPSSHLILGRPLLLLAPIPPSIRVFSNESTLRMRWPKHWSLSFSISPSKEHPELISFRITLSQLSVNTGTKSFSWEESHDLFFSFGFWVYNCIISTDILETDKTWMLKILHTKYSLLHVPNFQ